MRTRHWMSTRSAKIYSDGSGAIGMPSHFWCSLSSSPFIVLKKMKLSSQRSRVCSPICTPMWAGLRRMTNLRSNSLFGFALQQVGNDQAVGGEQVGLAGQVGGRGRRVVLGAHDVGLAGSSP